MATIAKIYLGADHAGFVLKESVKKRLSSSEYSVEDCGNRVFEPQDDYPDYASSVAANVASSQGKATGILFCTSGQGMCIVANKFPGVQAVVVHTLEQAKKAREHNDANVLCLDAKQTNETTAIEILHAWLETPFSEEERHKRRLTKIRKIEEER